MNMTNQKPQIQVNPAPLAPASLLGIAFIILKLCGVIDWSWWWVTAPFWVPAVLVGLVCAIPFLVMGIIWLACALGTLVVWAQADLRRRRDAKENAKHLDQ